MAKTQYIGKLAHRCGGIRYNNTGIGVWYTKLAVVVGGRIRVWFWRVATGRSFCLFERSEFLVDASQKKVCAYDRLILVLVWGQQTVYGQKTVYLCLCKYIVFENTHTVHAAYSPPDHRRSSYGTTVPRAD